VIQTLWIPGPLPCLNDIIAAAKGCGGRGYAYAKMKDTWTSLVANRARAQRIVPVSCAHFRFEWHERSRQRNPDNIAAAKKFVLDGLVTAKVFVNDGWSQIAGWSDAWEVDARKPGVLVTIEEVNPQGG
jgi:hypothetical protein